MDDGDDSAAQDDRPANPGGPGPAPGSEEDFRALAEDWIAIWQSEITAYLMDPETQAQWAALTALWAEAAQAMLRGMPGGFGSSRERRSTPATRPAARPDAAPGAAPAPPAPDPRDDEVRRLEQRVAELERRLAGRDGPSDSGRPRGAAGADRRARGPGRRRS
ncbi:hypothetical protein Acid7E03_32430 [Acidisoma sp. 7E03]